MLWFILVIFIWYKAKNSIDSGRSDCLKDIKKETWKGIVHFKEKTGKNHNFGEVYIKQTNESFLRKINCGCYDENFFDIVEIGDSLFKESNDFNCFVISDSNTFLFEPSNVLN